MVDFIDYLSIQDKSRIILPTYMEPDLLKFGSIYYMNKGGPERVLFNFSPSYTPYTPYMGKSVLDYDFLNGIHLMNGIHFIE